MTRAENLSAAYQSLGELLNRGDADEDVFQKWFEDNPLVFEVLVTCLISPDQSLVENRRAGLC